MAIIVPESQLRSFVEKVFRSFALTESQAQICADVLLKADLRGVYSHGVARLKRYVDGIANGLILPTNTATIVKETPATATVDGQGGLGQIVSHYATQLAITKAKNTGIGIVTVRNSNHYGIAGYYSEMIVNENMIGVSMTNSAPLVVPTFGKEMMFGTNPISMAAPAKRHRPFLLDMATSVVPRGKLEVYNRAGKELPQGWAVDAHGKVSTNPGEVLQNMLQRSGGGILPLGGEGELFSGHKGYGLALIVEILCGVLSDGAYADLVYAKKDGNVVPPNVCHFFMAVQIENFIELSAFTAKMDDLIERLKNSAKAEGQPRIFVHGEKEDELYQQQLRDGIPLQEKVYDTLKEIGQSQKVTFAL